jgi:hypothetical protein
MRITGGMVLRRRSATFTRAIRVWAILAALSVLWVASGHAAAVYDPGPLSFSTVEQSMWGTGSASVFSDSVFVGTQWTNRTAGIGGIVGSVGSVTINTNPFWWAWKACKDTIDFLCGGEPAKGTVTEVIDTRTGARVDLTSSGKFGLEFGYTVDSGSVNATAVYAATAGLPAGSPAKGEFFDLQTSSTLTGGALSSQSPKAEAFINAIAQLSGSVTAKACLITLGCAEGTTSLPTLNARQPMLSIDPNSIKVLPDLLPPETIGGAKRPLAEVKLLNQTLTLQLAIDATATPGFKLTTSQFTIIDTTSPAPDLTFDLASIEFKLPNIATSGGLVPVERLTSAGRDDIIKARIDLDALAMMFGFPALGVGLDLLDKGGFKIGGQFDALDIDAGPDIGITQDFELVPTLMVRLDFSTPVLIAGLGDPQTFWEGAWELLPQIALLETTTFTPTFWIEAVLRNIIGIDLGLVGTMDILKFSFTAQAGSVTLLGTNPISLNNLLGLGNELFSTSKLEFPIWDSPFPLGGFGDLEGAPFTIALAPAQAPTPGALVLILAGVGAATLARRRRSARPRANPARSC